jgi:hypothetical protein
MTNDEAVETSEIDSHPAFGGIIASIELSPDDWRQLNENGFVTVVHHRDSHDGDSVIELTIRVPVES